jgi:surface antigen
MRIHVAVVAATMILSGALSACSTLGQAGRPATPTPASAATGPAAPETIIAAMDGGLIGGTVGSGLSENDRRTALQAEYRALEYTAAGKAVDWKGSRGSGAVTAAQPYRVGSQDCRQYTQTVNAGGQNRSARGTACRNPDGSWTPLT